MTKFFMYDSELEELEQLMMLVPNFVPRGSGMVVVRGFVKGDPHQEQVTLPNLINQVGVKSHVRYLNLIDEAYESLIANCIHECKLYRFRSRLEYLIRTCSGDFFTSPTHKARFDSVCRLQEIPIENRSPIHLAVLFLLTADDKLWSAAKDHVYAGSFNFKKMILSGINTDGYAIYQMAKTIYTAKECISMDEIADKFLIGDQAFKAIIHSILIAKYGATVFRVKFK